MATSVLRPLVGALLAAILTPAALGAYTLYGDRDPVEAFYPYLRGPYSWSGRMEGWDEDLDVAIAAHVVGDGLSNRLALVLYGKSLGALDRLVQSESVVFWVRSDEPNPLLCVVARDLDALKGALKDNSALQAALTTILQTKEDRSFVWNDTRDTEWRSRAFGTKTYRGLFTNPDYSDPKRFLQEDPQTRFTPELRALAALVNDRQDLSTVKELYNLIKATVRDERPPQVPLFESTAGSILSTRVATGCTDYAIAFATLARLKGLPAVVVNAAQVDWVQRGAKLNGVSGHFFVEVLVQGTWYLVDSTAGTLFTFYDRDNWVLPSGYIAFTKALSVVDSGVTEGNMTLLQRVAFWGHTLDYEAPDYAALALGSDRLRAAFAGRVDALALRPRFERVTVVPDAGKPEVVVKADRNRVIPGLAMGDPLDD